MEHFQDHVMKVLFYVYVHVFEVPDCGLNGARFPVGATYPAYTGGCLPGLKPDGGRTADLSHPVPNSKDAWSACRIRKMSVIHSIMSNFDRNM